MYKEERFKKYEAILKRADWEYPYADGEAYYKGQDSVFLAKEEKWRMEQDFPADKELIEELWNKYYR